MRKEKKAGGKTRWRISVRRLENSSGVVFHSCGEAFGDQNYPFGSIQLFDFFYNNSFIFYNILFYSNAETALIRSN